MKQRTTPRTSSQVAFYDRKSVSRIIIVLAAVMIVAYLFTYPTGHPGVLKFKTEHQKAMAAFDKINKIRLDHDRDPLEWDEGLYKLAQSRARDMDRRNYFSHVTPEGKRGTDVKRDYGINTGVAESIFKGTPYHYLPFFSYGGSIRGWQNSPDHRKTMLSHGYSKGALAKNGPYYVFLVTYDL